MLVRLFLFCSFGFVLFEELFCCCLSFEAGVLWVALGFGLCVVGFKVLFDLFFW